MEQFRAFGNKTRDGNGYELLVKEQAKEIEKYGEIQRGMDLVISTIREFESRVKEKEKPLMEYVSGAKGEGSKLVPASDVTRMDLGLRIASVLSKLKMDEFRLSSNEYIHVDEVILRIPKIMDLAKRMFAKERDLLLKHKEGDRNVEEQINEEFKNGLKEIFSSIKTGEKK